MRVQKNAAGVSRRAILLTPAADGDHGRREGGGAPPGRGRYGRARVVVAQGSRQGHRAGRRRDLGAPRGVRGIGWRAGALPAGRFLRRGVCADVPGRGDTAAVGPPGIVQHAEVSSDARVARAGDQPRRRRRGHPRAPRGVRGHREGRVRVHPLGARGQLPRQLERRLGTVQTSSQRTAPAEQHQLPHRRRPRQLHLLHLCPGSQHPVQVVVRTSHLQGAVYAVHGAGRGDHVHADHLGDHRVSPRSAHALLRRHRAQRGAER